MFDFVLHVGTLSVAFVPAQAERECQFLFHQGVAQSRRWRRGWGSRVKAFVVYLDKAVCREHREVKFVQFILVKSRFPS
jgi:hypothetical protein